jgi:hypothetical protein
VIGLVAVIIASALLASGCGGAHAGFDTTGSMTVRRSAHTATLLSDGRVLIAGGSTDVDDGHFSTVFASAELYDPATGKFSATGSMAYARCGHTATLLPDGRVLVAGGGYSAVSGVPTQVAELSAELYDPATGKFSPTGSMTVRRIAHTATLLSDGRVLIVGGHAPELYDSSAELYDPTTGTFSATGSMTVRRSAHTATLLSDGRVLIVGGDGSASAELYDPTTGTFSATGSMAYARWDHTATLLPDGRVLVAGGGSFSRSWPGEVVTTATAELYDSATGTFSPTGSMTTAQHDRTATLLSDGRVLIAGGWNSQLFPSSRFAELYDPKTGAFSDTTSMASGRISHTATLLSNGRVLIAGGRESALPSHFGLSSAELFEP